MTLMRRLARLLKECKRTLIARSKMRRRNLSRPKKRKKSPFSKNNKSRELPHHLKIAIGSRLFVQISNS